MASNALRVAAVAGAFSAALAISSPVFAAERTMIVLDASGSMWGQIEGEAKISIARRVLSDVLGTVPGEIELGLMAYGHRQKGQCGDIETLVAPAAGSAATISGAADGLSPLGKTPLTASVRRAAEELKYTEDKATVVLITDGVETCEADPCALGRELERLGVDFTAHVVGFGLSADEGRQVACLAEETGGLYLPADDAEQLTDALTTPFTEIAEAAEPEPEPEPAVERPEASLDAPDSIEIGRTFTIGWTGPGENRDVIEMHDPDARQGEGVRVGAKRVVNGDLDAMTVDLIAPVNPGSYELRYMWQGDRKEALATRVIEVVEAPVSLDAPANVAIGRTFTVEWVGPGARRDTIRIFDAAARQGEGNVLREKRLVNDDIDNQRVSLQAPAEPGFYELQYYSGDGREVLASRQIEVLEAPVTLDAPAEVAMGTSFTVAWQGPGARRDQIEIYDETADAGRGKVVSSLRIVNGDMDAQTVKLVAPTAPGTYTLRYYNGDNRAVLATLDVTIVELPVSLDAPDEVGIGATFSVAWEGPGARRDQIEIFDPQAQAGRGDVLYYKRIVNGDMDKQTVDLIAPTNTGNFELRYFNGDSRAVLATRPIAIVGVDVSLEAPDTAKIGHTIEVKWQGPGAARDQIEVFDPGAQAGRGDVLFSKRILNGDMNAQTVDLIMPAAPGTYELRYYSGDGREALATRPITVEGVPVSLDAPSSVPAGEYFEASWVGPGAYRDQVEVFDPQAQGGRGKLLASARLSSGSYDEKQVRIKAPAEPGSYLLRYYNADSRVVLFETGITVE
ncbi:MAG: VWA domain-containing protein [Rhizobiaceae bacterium]|nr:VWA domain-containing protein [Rhizobiaceae bacterium]